MNLLLITLIVLIFIILLNYLGKSSIVALNLNSWSLLFYKEILFILPAVFLISIYGVESFRTFILAEKEMEAITTWLVIYCLMSFLTCIVACSLLGLKSSRFLCDIANFDQKEHDAINSFGLSAGVTGLALLLLSIFFLGYKHAFITSIFSEDNLIKVRLANTYHSNLPSQVIYLISLSTFITTIFSVYLFRIDRVKMGCVFFMIALFIATSDGAKGIVVNIVVIGLTAYFYFFKAKIKIFRLSLIVITVTAISLILLFYVLSLQVTDLTVERFLFYLVDRIGVDQMAGTYETFSVGLNSPEYAWHAIPFAHFFVDYNIFSKDLMLLSEGGTHTSVGVKNSLFIAEAYGMGGWELAIPAPFLFAFGYIMKLLIIYFTLTLLFSKAVSHTFTLPLLFLTTKLTGDFSSVVLQKGTILLLISLIFIYLISLCLNLLVIKK